LRVKVKSERTSSHIIELYYVARISRTLIDY